MKTYAIRSALLTVLVHALFLWALAAAISHAHIPSAPQCTTDTDCAALCDPNDNECDGGPQ